MIAPASARPQNRDFPTSSLRDPALGEIPRNRTNPAELFSCHKADAARIAEALGPQIRLPADAGVRPNEGLSPSETSTAADRVRPPEKTHRKDRRSPGREKVRQRDAQSAPSGTVLRHLRSPIRSC